MRFVRFRNRLLPRLQCFQDVEKEWPCISSYDFKAYQGSQVQLVSWSAGTGDIGPTLFELGGSRCALELAMSDKLGPLDKDELVLWREVISATETPTATPIPTPAAPPP